MIVTDSRGQLLRFRADQWMARHPETVNLFERFALEMLAKRRRFGVKMLSERIRWFAHVETDDGERYKVNSSYVSFIARELIRRHPDLANYIQLREIRS